MTSPHDQQPARFHSLWLLVGRIMFWLTCPLLVVYLRIGKRTRVLVQVGSEFLVVKGWYGDGRWQLPGGGLHHNEKSVAGALRELSEETGIVLHAHDLKLVHENVYAPGLLRFRYDLYKVELPTKPAVLLQAGELVDYAWLPLPAQTYMLTHDSAQALARLNPTE